jgi:hypothetical protein
MGWAACPVPAVREAGNVAVLPVVDSERQQWRQSVVRADATHLTSGNNALE